MMKRFFQIMLAACLLTACHPGFSVYDLRCEGLVEPLGIDNVQPHFSWKIQSDKPMEQVAYEIEVGPDLWQSGRVESAEQVMVPYAGKPLVSRQQAWWRVRVWKSDKEVSKWSQKQRFGVGVIGDDALRGDYIGAVPGEGRAPLLRKSFQLDKKPAEALLYVNSLGYHEAFLNGEKVSDAVLQPAVSQLDKRSLIVVYDVTNLLKKGENELLIAAGSGWYKPATFDAKYAGPLVKAELDADGRPAVWTDASWEGAWIGAADLGSWRAHGFGGERIVAGTKPEWGPVDVVPVDGIVASMQMCEPCRVQETLQAVDIKQVGDSSWRVDFGRIVNALFEIRLPAQPEGHVTVATFADEPAERFDRGICGWDEYVSSGNPEGDLFVNRFNHHIFRYVQLDGLAEAPKLEGIRAYRMRTDFTWGGSFESSDAELNALFDLVDWSMENLAFDGYMVDCASIERLGYGGDGNASTLSLQAAADVAPLYLNWLQAWEDAQRPDGGLPHTAPNPYKAGGGPYWCTFPIQASWRTWMRYGDKRPVERFYPVMKRFMDYVDTYTVDGLLKEWPTPDYRWWYLGDWAAPQEMVDVQDPASVDLVNNCAIVQSLVDLVEMAHLLGEEADAKAYEEQCEALRKRIHEVFWHDGIYASGSQIDLVYPMLVGVVPPQLKETVVQSLFDRTENLYQGHLATGLVGIPVLTEWATLEGQVDWLYGLLKKHGYPGYMHMLDNGATGVWEHWDGARSHLHNCYNGIGSWFYEALGGIRPLEPGCRRVLIDPQVPEGLEWVKVKRETPYGTITVHRQGDQLQVSVPVGVTAIIDGKVASCGGPEGVDMSGGAQTGDLIPAPAVYTAGEGSVRAAEIGYPAIRISEKALLRRLKGRRLMDWQLKSAYWLEVGKKGVRIEAADEEGAFYALQSLKMLASLNDAVSYCTILDWPRFRHRGLMLDESRNFQGKAFVKKQLDMMALLKMNRFHFHLVDNPGWRLQIDAYPRLTQLTAWRPEADFWDWEKDETGGEFVEEGTPGAYGGYYTKQDIAEILSYAVERHIEVIPEIEMPGHNYETRAAYPEMACSLPPAERPDAWELCPGKESTYEFLEKVLLEVFELFPSPYVHIGGDEAGKDNWARCPDCQARMKAEGLENVEELQSYLIKRIERFAMEHGKRIIGWDEILEGGLAPDATVMSWRGTEGGLKAIAEGHDVIFTPTHYCYLDYHQGPQYRPVGRLLSLEQVYSFDPLGEGVDEADAHHVLGVQGNLWTEWVHEAWHAEMQLYPRAFAIAEIGWSQPEKKDYPDFKRRSDAWGRVARDLGYTLYTQSGASVPASGASDFSADGLVRSRKGEYEYVTFTAAGQWTGYRFLGLSETPDCLTVTIQAGQPGGRLEARAGTPDGPVIATLDIPDTGWKWKERTVPVEGTLAAGEGLYLVAVNVPFSVKCFTLN